MGSLPLTDTDLRQLDIAARKAPSTKLALKLKNKYEFQCTTLRRLIAEGKELGLSEEESIRPALREGVRRMLAVEGGRRR